MAAVHGGGPVGGVAPGESPLPPDEPHSSHCNNQVQVVRCRFLRTKQSGGETFMAVSSGAMTTTTQAADAFPVCEEATCARSPFVSIRVASMTMCL